jgi:hypothetical protein
MSLDCNTEKGRFWIQAQNQAASRFAEFFNMRLVYTSDTTAADIDCLFFKNDTIKAIAEIKSRDIDRAYLEKVKTYLITKEKLEKGVRLARALVVPYLLIVNCVKDNSLVWWKIANSEGEFCVSMNLQRTVSQNNCNGGEANRYNAYIPITEGKWL